MSYDDRQAAAILKKAVELHSASAAGVEDPKLSIDDLKRIAAEVGIAPETVEEAARRTNSSGSKRSKLAIERVLTVDRELGEREYEEIVGILRSEYGQAGTASTLGSAMEWSAGEMAGLHLSMMPRTGKTTITVSQRQDAITVVWVLACVFNFLGILMPLAITGKHGQILLGGFIALLLTILFVGGASLISRGISRSGERKLDEVMNRIAEVAGQSQTAASAKSLDGLAKAAAPAEEEANLNVQS